MSDPVMIGIAGALGRMGRALTDAAAARSDMVIAGRFDRPDADAPGLAQRDVALAACEVVVDFTTPAASAELAAVAAARGAPALVIGATGASAEEEAAYARAARRIPIVYSRNYSLGVNLLMGLVEQAARALSAEAYDIEVTEAHHRRKVDAPSGTALMLGEAAARGRGVDLAAVAQRGRDGITGARRIGDIGFAVVRGGGIFGEHQVLFAAEDEVLSLSHAALDRGLFARGALEAARWVKGRPPGLYDMQDVLGLKG
ncbi:MAG: 4-hydroxy-tetrahydrodipicolinate reductase [Caulobacteraceae bacterium]|nr:4-hydroxy-tetrahydrodipicolinate reductase [Caulobacteraceae bacterium]